MPARSDPSGPGSARMRAAARVSVQRMDGVDRLVECSGRAPVVPRRTRRGVDFVGSAAGPLAGDVLTAAISVGAGASLRVGSVAASYARPGPTMESSLAVVEATVGQGGRLSWTPEPLIAVDGCRHRMETSILLDREAELFWAEAVVLGRVGEAGGDVWMRRSVDLDGRALNRQELSLRHDRSPCDPAVLGGARVFATCLVVHPEWSKGTPGTLPLLANASTRVGVLRLAGPAVEVVGLGQTVLDIMAAFAGLADAFGRGAPATAEALRDYAGAPH